MDALLKILIIIGTILFICLLLIKRFVYFRPSNNLIAVPENYESIYIRPQNIHGYFIQGTNDRVILFCHGNAGNISYRQQKIEHLINLGYSVMIFDYTGFGLSDGVPSEQNCYRDGCLFMERLKKQYLKENIILYGESLGAAVAAYLAVRYKVPYLILESSLPSIKRIVKRFPGGDIFSFFFPEFDTESYVKAYKGKSLVIHSLDDTLIPYNMTDNLREYCTNTIAITGDHNNPNIPWLDLDDFLKN